MKIRLPQLKNSSKQAFSILETIVAVAILSIVLLASITLGSVSMRNMIIRAQTAQATSLAQERLEQVRGLRDQAWLSGTSTSWDGWTQNQNKVSFCDSSASTSCDQSCTLSSCLDKTGRYQYSEAAKYLVPVAPNGNLSSATMKFGDSADISYYPVVTVRSISSDKLNPFTLENGGTLNLNTEAIGTNNHEVKILEISVTVSWQTYGENSVTLSSYLSDWLPRF